MHLADTAADIQEDRERHFRRYAAQAAACKRAVHDFTLSERAWLDKEKPTLFEREVWYAAYHDLESAYDEAYGELEDVCTSSPYHALSEKYRCACGKSVVYCECMTKCECMVPRDSDDGGDCGGWVEKWSWRLIDDWCECRHPPRRAEPPDWPLLSRRVHVGKDGIRSLVPPILGCSKHTKRTLLRHLTDCDFCPQTGVCLLPMWCR